MRGKAAASIVAVVLACMSGHAAATTSPSSNRVLTPANGQVVPIGPDGPYVGPRAVLPDAAVDVATASILATRMVPDRPTLFRVASNY